jgi:hypothetical protein
MAQYHYYEKVVLVMFDLESKILALMDNFGLALLMEQNDVSEYVVLQFLIDNGYIDLDDYFNLDAELEEWKRTEE